MKKEHSAFMKTICSKSIGNRFRMKYLSWQGAEDGQVSYVIIYMESRGPSRCIARNWKTV